MHDTQKSLWNSVKLLGEVFVTPGSSLLLDGRVGLGLLHSALGIAATALLGPAGRVGAALIALNSYNKSNANYDFPERVDSGDVPHPTDTARETADEDEPAPVAAPETARQRRGASQDRTAAPARAAAARKEAAPESQPSGANIHTESYGGRDGSPFHDPEDVISRGSISQIDVHHGNNIDGILLHYGASGVGNQHGGTGGQLSTFRVPPGEVIIRVEGRAGTAVDCLQFITDKGTESPRFGGNGGAPFKAEAGGNELRTISGRAGHLLDQITCHFRAKDGR
jgi:hypothetical protein